MRKEYWLKIKCINLTDLERLGWREETFGLYGGGDYIPQHRYCKTYCIGKKSFELRSNWNYLIGTKDRLVNLTIWKIGKKKSKIVLWSRFHKIVRMIEKDLLECGIAEKVVEE